MTDEKRKDRQDRLRAVIIETINKEIARGGLTILDVFGVLETIKLMIHDQRYDLVRESKKKIEEPVRISKTPLNKRYAG